MFPEYPTWFGENDPRNGTLPGDPARLNGDGRHAAGTATKPAKGKGKARTTSKRQSCRRFQTANEFYSQIEASGLGPAAVAAWLVLWLRTDAKSGLVHLSYGTLAAKVGLKKRRTIKVVAESMARGFVELNTRGTAAHVCNSYRLNPNPASKGVRK